MATVQGYQERRKQLSRLRADECLRLWEAGQSQRQDSPEERVSEAVAAVHR